MDARGVVTVDGREVPVSSLDRVVYPAAGFTKADVLSYYGRVARVLVPHVAGRACETRRYPDGVAGEGSWQRDLPPRDQRPPWVQAARVHARSRGGDIEYPDVVDAATLLWLANHAALELHVFLAPWRAPKRPTVMVFDLDPGPGRDVVDAAVVALRVRAMLDGVGLRAFPKTSGSKGLQLYVPLHQDDLTFRDTKAFARTVAEVLARDDPGLVVAKTQKTLRQGRVLVDWGQNEHNHLMVAPYSLRAREQPTVSTPLRWREVEALADARDAALARFLPDDVLRRVEADGDLFADVLTLRQQLP